MADGTWNVPATLGAEKMIADGTWNVPATFGAVTRRAFWVLDAVSAVSS